MSSKNSIAKTTTSFILFFLALVMGGCSASTNLWGDPESGLVLTYRLEENKEYNYKLSNKMDQELDMMGQKINTKTLNEIDYTITNLKTENNNLNLSVKINGMTMLIESPQGEMKPDLSSVQGKSFTMMLSKLGKEHSFIDLELIKYNVAEGMERGITDFQRIFPNLSAKPIKINEGWSTTDSLNIDEGTMSMLMIFNSSNTIVGIEKINGLECAKINSEVTGKLEGAGSQGSMDFTMEAELGGTEVWYFAYKEGVFVKSSYDGGGEGKIVGTQMTIPFTMKMGISNELVR